MSKGGYGTLPPRQEYRRTVGASLIVLLVAGVVGGVFYVIGYGPGTLPFLVLLLTLLTVVAVIPLVYRIRRRHLNIGELGLWFTAFYAAHFVIGGFHAIAIGGEPLNHLSDEIRLHVLSIGLIVALGSLIAFWIGYTHPLVRRTAQQLPTLSRRVSDGRLVVAVAGCLAVGWMARFIIMYITAGGFLAWMTTPAPQRYIGVEGLTYLKMFGDLAALGGFLLLAVGLQRANWQLGGAGILVFIPEVIFRFLTGARLAIPAVLLGVVVMTYLLSDRSFITSVKFGAAGAASVGVLVLMFPFVSAYRHSGSISPTAIVQEGLNFSIITAVTHRLMGVRTLSYLIYRVPEGVPHFYGRDFLLIPQAVIPRAVWPNKPQTSMGRLYTEQIIPPGIYPEAVATAPTLPGQLYWSGGLIAVIIGMIAVGALWRFLNDYLVEPGDHPAFAAFIGAIFPMFFMVAEQDFIALFTRHLFQFTLFMGVIVFVSIRPVTIQRHLPASGPWFADMSQRLGGAWERSTIRTGVKWIGTIDFVLSLQRSFSRIRTRLDSVWRNSRIRSAIANSILYRMLMR